MPHYQAKMSAKGRLTIPLAVRQHFDLKPGDVVDFFIDDIGRSVRILARNKSISEPLGVFELPPGEPPATLAEMDDAIAEYLAEKHDRISRRSIFDHLEDLKLPSIGRPVTQADIDAAIGEAMGEQERRIRRRR